MLAPRRHRAPPRLLDVCRFLLEGQAHVGQIAPGFHQHQRTFVELSWCGTLTRHMHGARLGGDQALNLCNLGGVGMNPDQAGLIRQLVEVSHGQNERLSFGHRTHGFLSRCSRCGRCRCTRRFSLAPVGWAFARRIATRCRFAACRGLRRNVHHLCLRWRSVRARVAIHVGGHAWCIGVIALSRLSVVHALGLIHAVASVITVTPVAATSARAAAMAFALLAWFARSLARVWRLIKRFSGTRLI